jgi:hypothetical protein
MSGTSSFYFLPTSSHPFNADDAGKCVEEAKKVVGEEKEKEEFVNEMKRRLEPAHQINTLQGTVDAEHVGKVTFAGASAFFSVT